MKLPIEKFLELSAFNPVLDVRAPTEFSAGHIPGAINFPLFNDDERKTIGTLYRKHGHFEAVLLGLDLVKDRLSEMVRKAVNYEFQDAILVHCWRGGMRSESVSWLLNTARLDAHTLVGGYKSFRNHVLNYFDQPLNLAIISGTTGTGKTEILKELKARGEQVIDLEQLARHKGSVFGGIGQKKQPTSEHFQNLIFDMFKTFDPDEIIWLEDENPVIGKTAVPEGLWRQMVKAPRVRLTINKKVRIQRIVNEYAEKDFDQLCNGIAMLEKRLGNRAMTDAISNLKAGNPSNTVAILLDYYDKAYNNSFEKKKETEWIRIDRNALDIPSIVSEILEKSRQQITS